MKHFIFAALLIASMIGTIFYLFQPKENPHLLTLYGNVDVRLVDIGFRVQGQVNELFFEEGEFVKQGTLLTTLDKTPYDSKLNQAIATLEALKTNLINAEILLERRKELIGVGGISQEDLDNAKAKRDEAMSAVIGAEANVNVALDDLKYTEAYAPNDGIILTRVREPGSVVNPTDPVYTLSLSCPIWIRAYVAEPDLGKVKYGMKAKVLTDLKNGPVYTGYVGFISPIAEFTPKTVQTTELRTDLVYRLRIYIDNPDQILKQGMPVTVKLAVDP